MIIIGERLTLLLCFCLQLFLVQMPSFDLMDKVELYLRTGTFPVDASKSSKKVTRATSKLFTYKGTTERSGQVTSLTSQVSLRPTEPLTLPLSSR